MPTVGPSHYVVRFHCDKCVSIISRKQLVTPALPTVGDKAEVIWNGARYSATIMATGDQETIREAERRILESLENESVCEERRSPPTKKRRVFRSWRGGKENKQSTKVHQRKKIRGVGKQTGKEQVKKVCTCTRLIRCSVYLSTVHVPLQHMYIICIHFVIG